MYITQLRIEGLRDAPTELTGLGRVAGLPPAPAQCAVGDALVLLASGLDPGRRTGFDGLGWSDALEVLGEADEDLQLQGLLPSAVGGSITTDARAVTVDAELELDPPLYGRLRAQAARDPRVATALGQQPTLSVKVGWLFNGDRTAVTPSVLGCRIGNVAFETVGRERPPWLPALLRDLGGRFARTQPFEARGAVEARLFDALLSTELDARSGYEAVMAALSAPPFSAPKAGLARVGGQPTLVFGEGLRTLRHLGRSVWDGARIAEAALVQRPDVLIVDEALTPEVAAWARQLPDGDDAPVEQVWVAS